MKDRSATPILVINALGLWVNAFVPPMHPAAVAAAQEIDLSNSESNVVGLK